jgi:hypothetical protein
MIGYFHSLAALSRVKAWVGGQGIGWTSEQVWTIVFIGSSEEVRLLFDAGGCIQKFPDWPPGAKLQMLQLSAASCRCIAILWFSLVSFAAITLCVASQRVFFIVVVYLVMTQSGNFWIYTCTRDLETPKLYSYVWTLMTDDSWVTWSIVGVVCCSWFIVKVMVQNGITSVNWTCVTRCVTNQMRPSIVSQAWPTVYHKRITRPSLYLPLCSVVCGCWIFKVHIVDRQSFEVGIFHATLWAEIAIHIGFVTAFWKPRYRRLNLLEDPPL